jgi:hypothetical protein
MNEETPFIELRICLDQPPTLVDLVSAFVAIGNQFDHYIRREHPNLEGAAQLFVKEIRKGSTIVELIPQLAPLIANMDAALIIDNFVRRYGGAIQSFIAGHKLPDASRSDIKDMLGAVTAIANDTDGRAIISSAVYHETKTTKRVEIQFDTAQAREAKAVIERQKADLELKAFEPFENVLMVFWQSNLKDPSTGKRTGERAIIETVWPKPLAVVYETDLAADRIKHETEQGDRNLYKLGFYVDCYVERLRGKPVAYRVTEVRDIIELPDDDDSSPPIASPTDTQ